MRILMIHNRYGDAARGGAERVVERLVDALQERDHVVEVYHHTTIGFDTLERLPVLLRALWHCMDTFNVVSAARLRARLRWAKPDVVHTHNLVGCGGLTPWVIRRSGILWVHTLHDVQLITPSGLLLERGSSELIPPLGVRGGKGELRADRNPSQPPLAPRGGDVKVFGCHYYESSFLGRWFRSLRRSLFGSPQVVTSPTRWLLQLHRSYRFFPESRDAVIGNPIDVSRMTRIRSADDTDTQISIASAYPRHRLDPSASSVIAVRRFCIVGQIEGQKGIFVLVEAYRQLRALFPDVSLHVVGHGSAFALLRRMSRDVRGLVLRGRLDADGVRAAIGESDVLVVPSLIAENQPSVILEAFASGIPVVASRVGGIPELIQDGETGFLVDPGSVEDLLRVLRLCVEDPKRIRGMAEACHTAAEAHATDHIAIQLEEVYTAVSEYAHRSSRESMGSFRER